MLRKILCSLLVFAFVALPVVAQQKQQNQKQSQQHKQLQTNPYQRADDSWIAISGTVASVGNGTFNLDYGDGTIKVDTRKWDMNRTRIPISDGDRITVFGIVDADLIDQRTIEARSLYVPDLNAHYFVNQQPKKIDPLVFPKPHGISHVNFAEPRVVVTGTVQQVRGRKLTLKAGDREVQVDTSYMEYNPLDKQGSQQLSQGDRVSIGGELDQDFFENQEILADTIVSLNHDSGKSEAQQSSG